MVGLCWAGFYLRCCYLGSDDVGVLSRVYLALAVLATPGSPLALPLARHWTTSQGPFNSAADETEEIKDRLAKGAPAFSLGKRSDLPVGWRKSYTAGQLCVARELPVRRLRSTFLIAE